MHIMGKEDIQTSDDEKENQENNDNIEERFQAIIKPKHHFLLQHFLATNQTYQLDFHIQKGIEV